MSTSSSVILVCTLLVSTLVGGGSSDANAQQTPSTARSPHATSAMQRPSFSIASAHPRIFLDAATRTRLKTVLASNSPAARRFRDQVDGQLAGRRAYAFQPWYAALMYQLSGDARYATYAIDETEKFVLGEEEKIARNARASVAGDSYLEVGQVIGNVALVYDWCHDKLSSEQRTRWAAYGNGRSPRLGTSTSALGRYVYAWTGWSVDNPSTTTTTPPAATSCWAGTRARTRRHRWIEHFRTTKIEGQW